MTSNTVVLFCGPSLPVNEARELLQHASVFGPARCGDIYRAVRRGATIVGIVDGYFEHTLSVWHKEVLWALNKGVRVYGAASMGALRAAELAAFGMVGVGRIFEQFHSGELLDDDEVAVSHEPEENGYRVQSDAMVNIRATLRAATDAAVLTQAQCDQLTNLAKHTFYPLRSLRRVLASAPQCLGQSKAVELSSWLGVHGFVNQKRADAIEMLERIERDLEHPTPSPCFVFEETDAWRTLKARLDREFDASDGSSSDGTAPPRFPPSAARDTYVRSIQLAAGRALARLLAEGEQASVGLAEAQTESEAFRKQRGLLSLEQTKAWLAAANLDVAAFSELIHDTVLHKRYESHAEELILRQLPNALRILGIFEVNTEDPK